MLETYGHLTEYNPEQAIICREGGRDCHVDVMSKVLYQSFKKVITVDADIHNLICEVAHLRPAVILLMVSELSDNLNTTVLMFRESTPYSHVILFFYKNCIISNEVEQLNVSGIFSEENETGDLEVCLKKISNGFRYISPSITNTLSANRIIAELSMFVSRQEYKVIQFIASGIVSNSQIAKALFLSPHTIKNHKENLVKKLRLKNVQDLYSLVNSYRSSLYLIYAMDK